ncbi:GpE family phage tail protein [Halomonas sp. OfavH-34-E]|uniref:GpE family phage tail protein n=1 Tax=Halomonas sp. OfavH-34-E TaxID=2954491 RepID=UPI0020974892|nr:GpE family phage tail protein [Halomonas sp. OfavH-34-E]MCO7217121.1 GpE family phage tail protein [Halomonas sp. OfavH-34-E]
MTALPADIMEAEADIYLVFTGWDARSTEAMSVDELMRWHAVALRRHEKAQEQAEERRGG